MLSVGVMWFILVLGFLLLVNAFSQIGLGLVSILISFCLGLCVLGT